MAASHAGTFLTYFLYKFLCAVTQSLVTCGHHHLK